MTTSPSERLFVGVPIAVAAREAIARHLRAALGERLPGRAVTPDNWHLTLRFLGATRPEQQRGIRELLRRSALGEPFRIVFGALGAFPRPRAARVLWLGVTRGGDALGRLAALAEAAARAHGFPPEERPYRAHLTLSRIDPAADVSAALQTVPPLDLEMDVREVVLFRSHLGRGPARYEAVESFPLAQ